MKVDLTKPQLEAIQKLLSAHSEIAGITPNGEVCWRAFTRIKEQTGISKVTEKDYKKAKKRLEAQN